MIVNKEDLTYVHNVVAAATSVGIESLIIEPDKIRAVDPNGSVVLLHTNKVRSLPFGSIGISRIPTFSSLLSAASGSASLEVTANVETMGGNSYVRSLVMKGKGSKIEYRCANPATIRAPKALNGMDPAFTINVDDGVIQAMLKGKAALAAEEVIISYRGGVAQFELSNINGDKFVQTISEDVTEHTDNLDSFSYKYPIKLITSVLNPSTNKQFTVTQRGLFHVPVLSFDVFIIPRN